VSDAGDDPELVTSAIEVQPDTMALWETDLRKQAACRYLLTRLPGPATEVGVEFYVQGNVLTRLLFTVLFARKLKARFAQSLRNLAALCEHEQRQAL